MIEFEYISGGGLRVKDLSGDSLPFTYMPPHPTYLHYYTDYGVWRRTTGNGKWEFDDDEERDDYRPTIIRECGIPTISLAKEEPELRGRHYDAIIEDDMIDEKEVKKKMYLQAIDVIFFDRKTKKVVYREIIVANDTEGAYMLAAQDFGKYDPKVHVKNARCLFGFNEQNAEDDEEEN